MIFKGTSSVNTPALQYIKLSVILLIMWCRILTMWYTATWWRHLRTATKLQSVAQKYPIFYLLPMGAIVLKANIKSKKACFDKPFQKILCNLNLAKVKQLHMTPLKAVIYWKNLYFLFWKKQKYCEEAKLWSIPKPFGWLWGIQLAYISFQMLTRFFKIYKLMFSYDQNNMGLFTS